MSLITTEDDESSIPTDQERPMVKGLHELIQRVMDDPEFRRRLLAAPEEVVRAEGYEIDSATIAKLKKASEAPSAVIDAAVEQMRKDEGRAG